MSRLTTAQIIEKGDYLKPDFEPSSLTVSQLLGVFGYHNVMYPSPYTKPKLVQLFNDEIKGKAAQLRKERLSRQNSQASDDGITDGLTGLPLNTTRKPTTRASSRRASAAPQDKEQVPEPSRPDPPKRRRSSAEPSLGGTTTRRRAAKAPEPIAVAEESEPDEPPPVRKVSRKKTTQTEAATHSRHPTLYEDVDSGWEDNNIFQSGAESASPSPVKPRPRRSSAIPKRKKSMSVPPQFAPPPSPPRVADSPRSPRKGTGARVPESGFAPELPEDVFRDTRATAAHGRRTSRDVTPMVPVVVDDAPEAVPEGVAVVLETETEVAEYDDRSPDAGPATEHVNVLETVTDTGDAEVASEDAAGEDEGLISSQESATQDVVVRRAKSSGFGLLQFFTFLLATATLTSVYNYKTESAPIGFCETGTATNAILESVKARRAAIEECNRLNRTTLFAIPYTDSTQSVMSPTPAPAPAAPGDSQLVLSEACPPPALLPIPPPASCAPCPAHAECTPSTLTCDTGYLVAPHPLLALLSLPSSPRGVERYTSPSVAGPPAAGNLTLLQLAHTGFALLLDGVPGLGPVALPPRCVEDPRRKRHVGVLGRALDKTLMQERGMKRCLGERPTDEGALSEVEKARKWGMDVDALKERLKAKAPAAMHESFDDLFVEAIQQLVELDSIFIGETAEGHRYVASRDEVMDGLCKVKVWTVETGRNNWKQISSALSTLALTAALWMRRQANSTDAARAQALAEQVYALLRNAEAEHHLDPATHAVPYLSSLQLRDALLQGERVGERRRLWGRVERVIGANANIVTSHEELEGGDEGVVWRWVGRVGRTVPYALVGDGDAAMGAEDVSA